MADDRPHRTTLLVVDDDEDIRAMLAASIESQEFGVLTAADGVEMYQVLNREQVDIIVLDLNLPGQDGLTLCRDISSRLAIPIIVLTARGGAIDRIVGLEMGADDYLPKPFETRELVARVKSILRRSRSTPRLGHVGWAREARFEGWVLHLKQRHLTDPVGAMVVLSGAEFRLLELFVHHANMILSRDQLAISAEAGRQERMGRTIDNQVSRLRQKLTAHADPANELIKTVRGSGYVLACEVTLA
jgi:two-component system OmpR family response regulator